MTETPNDTTTGDAGAEGRAASAGSTASEREAALEDALRKIADPVGWTQRWAKENGYLVNGGMAIAMANDAGYLRGIAREALDVHRP